MRLIWRCVVAGVLIALVIQVRALTVRHQDNAASAEATVGLAQAVLDVLDIIKALDERVKALEAQERQKRKIENLPNRRLEVTPSAVHVHVAERAY